MACVEEDLDDHLRHTIEWLVKFHETFCYYREDLTSFYMNNVALMRACQKRDMTTVSKLYKAGFRLTIKVKSKRNERKGGDELKYESATLEDMAQEGCDMMTALAILEGRASPAYFLAEHRYKLDQPMKYSYDHTIGDSVRQSDPVNKALNII